MELIGLIAAMEQESNALLRFIKMRKKISLGKYRGYSFSIGKLTCILVTSGMGARRAEEAARLLAKIYAPDALISFGIAGAVEPELDIGDVVLSQAVCRWEAGTPGTPMFLATWDDAHREAAAQALAGRGKRLWQGTAITTSGSQVGAEQLKSYLHPILEMETYGIALAAADANMPLFSLRAISDGLKAPLPFDLAEMMDADANLQASKLLKAVARHPGIIFQSRRLIKNTSIAAQNAAIALQAVLNLAVV